MRRIKPALARARAVARTAAAVLALAVGVACIALPARALQTHPAVTLRGTSLHFFAGRLIIDAQGGAGLDDGVVHVSADRIVLDISNARFVAAGNVRITGARSPILVRQAPGAASFSSPIFAGAALAIDLRTHRGFFVALAPSPAAFAVEGTTLSGATSGSAGTADPLALPDIGGELPFADASVAVVHLGADVRLSNAHVLVPGGRDVGLPSYVYTFSSETGYSASNVAGAGEEIPIYFGSTRNSVAGAHFLYNSTSKFGLGLDQRIVDGAKAYDLFSVAPLNGPQKTANFTWEEQINDHASQTLNGSAASGIGSFWNYNARDALHRSFLDFAGSTSLGGNFETIGWQGAYEPIGAGTAGSLFNYHLRSEYGRSQSYFGASGSLILHTALEADVQSVPMQLNDASTVLFAAGWRQLFDNQPHREFAASYGVTLQHRWNSFVTTQLQDTEFPVADSYPSEQLGTRSYVSQQIGTVSYSHGEAFGLMLSLEHQAGSFVPAPGSVQPWYAFADVRFRVNQTLAFDISRSYGFGYGGQRFGSLGFQILP